MKKKPMREAVALVYDGDQAPTLTAKGEGELAEQIVQLAMDYKVPIYENADLAKMLARMELGDQIPEELYRTIAEIIAFAWHLKGKAPEGFVAPETADLGPRPDDLEG